MKEADLINLRLPLVVGEKPRLEHEIPHVNKGSADLSPAITHHPTFVHNFRRHRCNSESETEISKTESLTDSEARIEISASSKTSAAPK